MAGDTDPPSDNGRPASIDRATGEVRGSGVGAGGGQPGEDLDSDEATRDGDRPAGGDGKPGDLGPAKSGRRPAPPGQ